MSFKFTLGAVATSLVLSLGVAAPSAHASLRTLFLLDEQAEFAPPDFGVSMGTVLVESNDPDTNLSGVKVAPRQGKQLLLDTFGGVDELGFTYSSFAYSFTAASAGTYAFKYNFLTAQFGDDAADDFFQVELIDGIGDIFSLVFESALTSTLINDGDPLPQTGARKVTFDVLAGDYTVNFLVGTEQAADCAGFDFECIPTYAVVYGAPEPSSMALAALGLFGAGAMARRARRRASQESSVSV